MRVEDDAAQVLVFDIGGSSIRAARVCARSSELLRLERADTPSFLSRSTANVAELWDAVFTRVRELGDRVLDKESPDVVVAGYPGPMTHAGVALRSPTILGNALDEPYDVMARMERLWPDARVAVMNDVTCAGYHYVARGHRDFCVIAVGSGVGNKVFLDGRPFTGPHGRGGEIGHLAVSPPRDSPVGGIENELGNIASGRGAVELAREWVRVHPEALASSILGAREIDSALLVEAFNADDPLAVRMVAASCQPLATAIGTIHLAIGLETFFLIGGFAKALGNKYVSLLVAQLRRTTWNLGQNWESMIEIGSGDSEESLLGAAYVGVRAIGRVA